MTKKELLNKYPEIYEDAVLYYDYDNFNLNNRSFYVVDNIDTPYIEYAKNIFINYDYNTYDFDNIFSYLDKTSFDFDILTGDIEEDIKNILSEQWSFNFESFTADVETQYKIIDLQEYNDNDIIE